ncbi:UTP--glucose-1-phosphate uridylyltransferase GalU [Candidatus Puniceispirillum sp.]|nr:UTP--glucose-1-phosphate uridylyltransferase GalU [Candidatus Puniceispirillum sp.]
MVKKAIFPVGGLGTRFLPATKALPKEMLTIVDKPLIQYAVEEAAAAGIEEFIFVTGRNKSAIEDHFDHSFELEETLHAKGKDAALKTVRDMIYEPGTVFYVRQQEPAGLGHAVWCARHLINDEPVAVLLADDLIFGNSCMAEMVASYKSGNMVAVMDIPKSDTGSYGIVTPSADDGQLLVVSGLVEKPSPENAPSNIGVVGRYIIEPGVFSQLENQSRGAGNEVQLTDALARQIGKVPFHGFRFSGERFDCGSKIGFLQANITFAMSHEDLADHLKNWIENRFLAT